METNPPAPVRHGLSAHKQIYALAVLAGLALLAVLGAFFWDVGAPAGQAPAQGKLASFVPTSQQLSSLNIRTVQKVEAGDINILITTLIRIQNALKCSWDKLLPSSKAKSFPS